MVNRDLQQLIDRTVVSAEIHKLAAEIGRLGPEDSRREELANKIAQLHQLRSELDKGTGQKEN